MTTGQFQKRRETDQAAEQRVERLRQRAADGPEPIVVAANGRRLPLNRSELRSVLTKQARREAASRWSDSA